MSNTIDIRVTDKCAALVDPGQSGVCDNDYTLAFDFDEEWSSYANKTARFTFNDSYRDVVFSGNSVEMAYISNAPHVDIGVYAGDLCTTTPARLRLKPSIRGFNGSPSPPTQDVYDQIMATLDETYAQFEAGVAADAASAATAKTAAETAETNAETAQAAAETAEANAETAQAAAETAEANAEIAKGNAESAQAAAEAAKTAAETAETNAETAQAAAETAEDNAAASATAAAASAESADYLPNTANALKRAISGTVVRMDDVSPLNHNLSFKQYGQCVQNGTPTPSVPIEITGKAAGANASGKNLCNPSNSYFDLSNMNVGDVITCSNSEINSNGGIQVKICSSSGGSSVWAGVISANTIGYKTKTLTATDISAGKLWLIRIYSDYQTLSSAEIIEYKIQLELGSTATEYEPYQAPITQIVTDSNGDPVTLYGIPVSSGGNVTIDGQQYVADTVEGTTLTRRVGVKVFDGTETFYKTYGDQTSYLYHFNLVHNILYSGKCTHFTPLPFARQEGTYSLTSSNEVVYINLTGLITTNDVLSTKAWFAAQYAANTPVILYYALTTPTTETVTLAPAAISANSPTTTVTAEAYTDTTYNRDAIKVIDELTAAIVALGGNI